MSPSNNSYFEKICFISPKSYGYFNPDLGYTGGGAERQLYLISQELKKQFDISFIVNDYGGSQVEKHDGITLHQAQLGSSDLPTPPLRFFDWLRGLLPVMYRVNADIYIDRNNPQLASLTYLCSQLLRKKWVYNIANDANITTRPDDLPIPLNKLYRSGIKNAYRLICQTDHQRDLLKGKYGVEASVVKNGYPIAEGYTSHHHRSGFLWVGELTKEQKQPDLYLNLAKQFPNEQFLLVGPQGNDSEYQSTLETRIAQLSNVEYTGPVSPVNIKKYYEEAKGLINTSAFEGFPNTFLEAWRVATPVLSLNVPPERLLDGIGSAGYADGDMGKLENLTKQTAEDTQYRRSLGFKSRNLFEEQLNIRDIAKQYAEALT